MKKNRNRRNFLRNKYKGFSLMEMLITTFIFVIIVMASTAAFASVIKTRKITREVQQNLFDGRAAMEIMAKNIRMSTKLGGNANSIYMYNNSRGKCIKYIVSGNSLWVFEGYDPASNLPEDDDYLDCSVPSGDRVEILSNVSGHRFEITPTNKEPGSETVGKAIFSLKIGQGNSQDEVLQTTVSFRDYKDIVQ
jgi:prepilin-type N-terminal cleavage/methylation domain-containing protein